MEEQIKNEKLNLENTKTNLELQKKLEKKNVRQKMADCAQQRQQSIMQCENCVHYLKHYILTHNSGFKSIHQGHCTNTIKNKHNNGYKFRDTSCTCQEFKKVTQKQIKADHKKCLSIFLPLIEQELKVVTDYLTNHKII